MSKHTALIIVDVQYDFLPGNALGVPKGNEVVPVINELIDQFEIVVATQDWHPSDHVSFAVNHPGRAVGDRIIVDGLEEMLWPVHCVQNTFGAAFAKGLRVERIEQVIKKGQNPRVDSYSGFFDNQHRQQTGLEGFLRAKEVSHVVVCGLATDYCVMYTVLDALSLGFKVGVFVPGCRGVKDGVKALQRCQEQGAMLLTQFSAALQS